MTVRYTPPKGRPTPKRPLRGPQTTPPGTRSGGRAHLPPGAAADTPYTTLPAAPGDGGPPPDAAAGIGPGSGLFRPAPRAAPRPPGGELTARRSTGVPAPSAAARQVRAGSEPRAGLASAARGSDPPNEGGSR